MGSYPYKQAISRSKSIKSKGTKRKSWKAAGTSPQTMVLDKAPERLEPTGSQSLRAQPFFSASVDSLPSCQTPSPASKHISTPLRYPPLRHLLFLPCLPSLLCLPPPYRTLTFSAPPLRLPLPPSHGAPSTLRSLNPNPALPPPHPEPSNPASHPLGVQVHVVGPEKVLQTLCEAPLPPRVPVW